MKGRRGINSAGSPMAFVTGPAGLVIDTFPLEEACAELTLAFEIVVVRPEPACQALARDVLALMRHMETNGTLPPLVFDLGAGQIVHGAPDPIPALLKRARVLGVI
jgi:hypothetical protein